MSFIIKREFKTVTSVLTAVKNRETSFTLKRQR